MRALLNGGLELAYDDVGTGVPLLFIHGWPHNRTVWAAQLSALPARARCIAPDLRGFGESSASPPHAIDQYADDLAALVGHLGIERAVVCGVSMGGYVALAMLRRHRSLVRGLILSSTRATADTEEMRGKRVRLIAFVREHGVDALASRQLKAMVGATTFTTRPDVLEALRQLMASAREAGVIGGLEAMAGRADATSLLAGIDMPCLVVSGSEDTFTTPDDMRRLASAIPRSRLDVIQRAGHLCNYERPAAFNHVVTEFLTALTHD